MNLERWKKMETVPEEGGEAPGGVPEEIEDDGDSTVFSDLDLTLFGGEEENEPVSVEPPAEEEPTPPPTEEAPPVVEESPPEPQPEPAAQPQPEAQAAPPVEEVKAPSYEEARQAAFKELETRYALSQEDTDAFISEPDKVVPRLVAGLYLDIYDNVMRSMQAYMPQMVQQITAREAHQRQGEDDFFTAWPKLKEHRERVAEVGRQYRQLNPTATKEQFIQDVGLHVMIERRIPLEGIGEQAAPPPPPPSATPQNPPHVPPRGPAAPAVPPTQQSKGMFGELVEEWDELEKGAY